MGAAALLGVALTGCRSPIRADGLDQSMGSVFTHLYALNQRQRALPVDQADLHTKVTCLRDNVAAPSSGPGDDWVCNIVWRTAQATSAGATYTVTVHAAGCFTADGDGPADLVGSPTLVDAEGETVVNPLWAFDGCLRF